jgi:hypothetical protein
MISIVTAILRVRTAGMEHVMRMKISVTVRLIAAIRLQRKQAVMTVLTRTATSIPTATTQTVTVTRRVRVVQRLVNTVKQMMIAAATNAGEIPVDNNSGSL